AASLGMILATTGITGCLNTQGRSYGQYRDDQKITSQVKEALKEEPAYKFEGVNVTSYERVVQLSGFVPTEEHRQRAAALASMAKGAKEVINNILVKPDMLPTGRTNAPVNWGQPVAPATSPSAVTNPPSAPEK